MEIQHLDMTDLWVQDAIRSKKLNLLKVLGIENMADVLTKYENKATMNKALET